MTTTDTSISSSAAVRQTFHDIPADRAIEITEGQDTYRVVQWSPISLPAETASAAP